MCKNCDTGGKPIALIWWRVSKAHQMELSPETQVQHARALLEELGFVVPDEYILGADWSSEEIMDCREMRQLLDLLQSGAIHAVGVYHPDRLAARPVDRLFFRTVCEQNKVKLVTCYGQIHEGPEGEFLDFAVTWGKYQQVLRAQQSSRDGLRARVVNKGLRASGKPPFGYEHPIWVNPNGESALDSTRLVASKDWHLIQRIWQRYMNGASIRQIMREFKEDGIRSPRGKDIWDPSGIANMLHNPVYAGRVYGLRYRAVQPLKRASRTYGKSSMADNPREDWVLLKVVVEQPVVTWEEYLSVQERMKVNQQYSPRNAKHQYLMRGMITCEEHSKTYHGRYNQKDHFVYVCSSYRPPLRSPTPCKRYIYGETLDATVWEKASAILQHPDVILSELERRRATQSETEDSIRERLNSVERKLQANKQAEAKLVNLFTRGEIEDDIFGRNKAMFKAERTWCEEEVQRLRSQLEAAQLRFVTLEQVKVLGERLGDRLASAGFEDKRFVLECLETCVYVSTDGAMKITFAIPDTDELALESPARCRPLLQR